MNHVKAPNLNALCSEFARMLPYLEGTCGTKQILEENAIKGGDRLFIRTRFVSPIAKDFNFLMDNKKNIWK